MFFVYKNFMNPMCCKRLFPVDILPLLLFREEPFDEKDLI